MLSTIYTSVRGARLRRHLCRGTRDFLMTIRSLAFRHIGVSLIPFLFLFVPELPFLALLESQRVCAARAHREYCEICNAQFSRE